MHKNICTKTYEELAKKYVSERSNLYVLSALFKKPSLLKDIEYLITEDDFTYKFEHVLFNTIYNLALKNINKIEPKDVESYLAETNKKAYEIVFDGADNEETFFDMIGLEEDIDFNLYYNRMKKMSLLRNYVKNGISAMMEVKINSINASELKSLTDSKPFLAISYQLLLEL